ncbi:hypothetical protein OROGR_026173 [Orobanche gracilis]
MDSGKEKVVQQLEALLGQLSLMDPEKRQVVAPPPPWKQQIEKLDLNTIEGLLKAGPGLGRAGVSSPGTTRLWTGRAWAGLDI